MKMAQLILMLALGSFLLSERRLPAQGTTAEIVGTVTDPSGALVPNAEITAKNIKTSWTRHVLSGQQGEYVLPLLPIGEYEVAAQLVGFKSAVVSGVLLQVGHSARVDFNLEVGQTSESVKVTAAAPFLQTENPELKEVVDNRQISELPLNGRSILQLATLSTGIRQGGGYSNLTVASKHGSYNSFKLDGVESQDTGVGSMVQQPSVEAVQEFELQKGLMSADTGKQLGASVRVALKSGTNTFHGAAFEFLRNDKLDARNFFQAQRRQYKRNQFGGEFDGPIIRNKLFFMTGYETYRIRQPSAFTGRVPTAGERTGDLSSFQKQLRDPLSGLPFPNNRIPTSMISPVSSKLMDIGYPLPNRAGDLATNFVSGGSGKNDSSNFFARVDYRISNKDTIFGDVLYNHLDSLTPPQLPLFVTPTQQRAHTAIGSWTHLFSPTVLNQVTFGYNKIYIFQQTKNAVEGRNIAKEVGIPGTSEDPRFVGAPLVTIPGFIPYGDATFAPQRNDSHYFQFTDSMAWVRGRHSVKFGMDLFTELYGFLNNRIQRGQFSFSDRYTTWAFADFLLGYPDYAARGKSEEAALAGQLWHFYGQDNWSVTPRLTVNLGLRWEANRPRWDKNGVVRNFDFVTGTYSPPLQRDPNTGVPIRDLHKNVRYYEGDYNNLAPRFGIAWRPREKTVVRTGYGIFYNQIISNANLFLPSNLPWGFVEEFFGNPTTPNLTFSNPFPSGALGTPPVPAPFTLDPKFRNGYVQQYSVTVEQQFSPDLLFDVRYNGNKATKLDRVTRLNDALPGLTAAQPRRPRPEFGTVRLWESSLNGNYNALEVEVRKRVGPEGLTFVAGYTFSKAIDDGGSGSGYQERTLPQNMYDRHPDRGLSAQDVTHLLIAQYVYELPFGRNIRGLSGKLLRGWQSSAIISAYTGEPLTVFIPGDPLNLGFSSSVRPNIVGNPNIGTQRNIRQAFDTSVFQRPPALQFGNAGRNIVRAPGLFNVDFSFIKNNYITEHQRLQLRVECFNFFNHTNFGKPDGTFGASSFGRITAAGEARQIQLGLRYVF